MTNLIPEILRYKSIAFHRGQQKAIKPSNQGKVVNLVGKYVGGDMAVKVVKYYAKIAEVKPLLKWAGIPAQEVEDPVYRTLHNFRVSSMKRDLLSIQLRPSSI